MVCGISNKGAVFLAENECVVLEGAVSPTIVCESSLTADAVSCAAAN